MAGLQAAIKALEEQGDDKDVDASRSISDLNSFYPAYMTDVGGNKVTKLFSRHKSPEKLKILQGKFTKSLDSAFGKSKDPHQLRVLYLQLCWHKTFYGSVFFKGIVEKPFQAVNLLTTNEKQVLVAVNTESVHLMKATRPSVSNMATR